MIGGGGEKSKKPKKQKFQKYIPKSPKNIKFSIKITQNSSYRNTFRVYRLVSFDHRTSVEEHGLYDLWLRRDVLRGATVFLPESGDSSCRYSFCDALRKAFLPHISIVDRAASSSPQSVEAEAAAPGETNSPDGQEESQSWKNVFQL